jgi:hypothetical protein
MRTKGKEGTDLRDEDDSSFVRIIPAEGSKESLLEAVLRPMRGREREWSTHLLVIFRSTRRGEKDHRDGILKEQLESMNRIRRWRIRPERSPHRTPHASSSMIGDRSRCAIGSDPQMLPTGSSSLGMVGCEYRIPYGAGV